MNMTEEMMKPVPPMTCGVQKKTSVTAVGGLSGKPEMTLRRPVLWGPALAPIVMEFAFVTHIVETQKIVAAHIWIKQATNPISLQEPKPL